MKHRKDDSAIRFAVTLVATTFLSLATAQSPPLSITSPASGTHVAAGQSLSVTVSVSSGTYPNGIGIIAQVPIVGTDLQPVVGSTMTTNVTIPADTSARQYSITAFSANSSGSVVTSAPIQVIVERSDSPTALTASTPAISLRFVGDTLPITIWGTFTGGVITDVTQSTNLIATSENTNVATFQKGVVSAVGSGQTNIDFQYGSITLKLPVTVPTTIRGDLNGDGVVDLSDVNIITASLNTSANGPNDARDLNHDGVINALDVRIEVTLCTYLGCASQ